MWLLLPFILFLLAAALLSASRYGVLSSHTLQSVANVGGVVSAVVAVIVLSWSIFNTNQTNQRGASTSQIHAGATYGKLSITSPKSDSEVDEVVAVEGYSEFPDLLHYIVVEPQTGGGWITDGPLIIHDGGYWEGRGQLGTGALGEGELFRIHVIATARKQQIGKISMMSVNDTQSAITTVNVWRRKEEQLK